MAITLGVRLIRAWWTSTVVVPIADFNVDVVTVNLSDARIALMGLFLKCFFVHRVYTA